MHRKLPPPSRISALKLRLQAGFSLVEVTLSIGIIAVAFVALLGLLPVGMSTFRGSIDASNEMWIMQSFNSMVQTTDYSRVKDLDFKTSNEIFYFDEEGRRVDTSLLPDSAREQFRLYAVKLIVQELFRPEDAKEANPLSVMAYGSRVMVVFAPVVNRPAMDAFATVTNSKTLESLPKNTPVKVRSFTVARMDSDIVN